jgi:hypothetical protein
MRSHKQTWRTCRHPIIKTNNTVEGKIKLIKHLHFQPYTSVYFVQSFTEYDKYTIWYSKEEYNEFKMNYCNHKTTYKLLCNHPFYYHVIVFQKHICYPCYHY